ncbi:uncharacterized protein YgbK (DUF1537 family) [Clostridium pascui]|uniref:four-carbon acid sugar kinase family protein n=1 Tax=Clostridium pascui TaxID=46609 RepID=UPI00195B2B25|nr:four-carbon acid sugar kinase family protein [Clostridium pascui]MBM7871406.1 uncharacterized protein YgbK (DUF1537 family) [Clostridium pascui]
MIKLLIIADDFTGALDTGVQFVNKGIETKIITDINFDFKTIPETTEVLVIDSETRPLSKEKAYNVVHNIVKRGMEAGINVIYKKTDSALRGNIGSELTAVIDAGGGRILSFIPAFPKVNRITKEGIHYLGGVPISETAFGKDPFEPVTSSYIPDIIKVQSNVKVACIREVSDFKLNDDDKKVVIFDAKTDEDIMKIARKLKETKTLKFIAGCAGFASYLPEILELTGTNNEVLEKTEGVFVACGSLNPITKEQVKYALSNGFNHINLTPEQKLSTDYFKKENGKKELLQIIESCKQNKLLVVDTFDAENMDATLNYAKENGIRKKDIRNKISDCLGEVVKSIMDSGISRTFMITGGDTLMGLMRQVNCTQLHPVCEIEQGAVLSFMYLNEKKLQIVSKSGGFGEKEVIVKIAQKVSNL